MFLTVLPSSRSLPTVPVSPAARVTLACSGSASILRCVRRLTRFTGPRPRRSRSSSARFWSQLALVEKISFSLAGLAPGRPTQTLTMEAFTAMDARSVPSGLRSAGVHISVSVPRPLTRSTMMGSLICANWLITGRLLVLISIQVRNWAV